MSDRMKSDRGKRRELTEEELDSAAEQVKEGLDGMTKEGEDPFEEAVPEFEAVERLVS